MRPSSPAGCGRIGDTLVFLLPGNPVSCLCAYDFFAGRAIRLRGGRPAEWPYRRRQEIVARKIVSAIGRVDYCRVRLRDDGRRAAGAERRIDPVVDDACRRLRHRARRQRRLCAGQRSDGLPLRAERMATSSSTRRAAAPTARQTQFLTVITRDEATERFRRHLALEPLGRETVPLADALHRVLADDVVADVDVPGFDRSNVDGFAVQASGHASARARRRRARVGAERRGAHARHGAAPTSCAERRATVIATGGDAAARRGRRRDGRAHRASSTDGTRVGRDRAAPSPRARTSATPGPTSRAARPCCARASS